MRKLTSTILLLALLAALVLTTTAGCAKKDTSEIKIGVIASETGAFITQGKNLKNGATMAVEEINAAGGINGHPITLVFANDDSTNEGAQSAAQKLINEDGVLAILGPCGTSTTYAAQQVTEAAETVLISHVGSGPKLTSEGQKFYFRNATSSNDQFQDLVGYVVNTLGKTKIGIAYDPGRTKADADSFTATLKGFNLEPVALVEFQLNDVSFGSQILKLKDAGVDAVMVLGVQQQVAAFASQAADMGLNALLMGNANVTYDEYITLAGTAAEGTVGPATFSTAMVGVRPELKAWADKYQAAYGEAPEHSSAQAYDAVQILAIALKGENISFKPEDLAATRIAIRDNIEQIKDYQGIAGVITYAPDDHDGYEHPNILQVKDGKWVLVLEAK